MISKLLSRSHRPSDATTMNLSWLVKLGKNVISGGHIATLPPTPAPPTFAPSPRPWFNRSVSVSVRANALVAALTDEECVAQVVGAGFVLLCLLSPVDSYMYPYISQLVTDAPAISHVGIPAYHSRNNVLHGLVDNGISTQFPQVFLRKASIRSFSSTRLEKLRMEAFRKNTCGN